MCFAPLLVYLAPQPAWTALLALPLAAHFNPAQPFFTLAPLALALVALLLRHRTAACLRVTAQRNALADQARESALRFARQSESLLEKQDVDIRLATLSERNRIARDIHDNVGHMLSRALLQTGALLVAARQTPALTQGLAQLKETLSSAMDSVRQSVHGLHDQSLDLSAQLSALAQSFTLCPVEVTYDADAIDDPATRYCFLAIAKEALSNTAKHALAPSRVSLSVREHPAFYQLDIRDDGQSRPLSPAAPGLGLRSIEERVSALGGKVHFSADAGFRVFVTVPKSSAQGGPP